MHIDNDQLREENERLREAVRKLLPIIRGLADLCGGVEHIYDYSRLTEQAEEALALPIVREILEETE